MPSREITYREAVREAMVDAMREDESVFLMGEDVAVYGGARSPRPVSSGCAPGRPSLACVR